MEENQTKIVSLINSLKKATFAIKGSEYEVSQQACCVSLFINVTSLIIGRVQAGNSQSILQGIGKESITHPDKCNCGPSSKTAAILSDLIKTGNNN